MSAADVEQALVEQCMLTEAVSPDGDPRTVINNLIQWHLNVDRHEYGRSRVSHVSIKSRQIGDRIFNSIRMDVGGMPMYCDLMDGTNGDLQIKTRGASRTTIKRFLCMTQ